VHESRGIARFRLGIWKLKQRAVRGGARYLLLAKEESESYVWLKCPVTQRWRMELLSNKRPHINKEIAIRRSSLAAWSDN
jgi:hypothetical protein